MLAAGAAALWPLALVGSAFLAVAALGLLAHWLRTFGLRTLLADGASASLIAAQCSLILLLLFGIVHGSGLSSAEGLVPAFVAGFLMPLVTGALAQLLPVWRFSGVQTPARLEMRACLVRCGRWRAIVLPVAAAALAMGQAVVGMLGVALGLGLFLFDLVRALRVPPPAR